ncbi:protein AMN1 homolog [Macrosteles quadrilineatus]|uniref:protein AMN1 homolog n=1 Tax=Macrosteles quadrilineatus TaxID=74068 RepID=UPI0023E20A55|nr:protein AMN1 homolog [Macrosteles quadrilineatus]
MEKGYWHRGPSSLYRITMISLVRQKWNLAFIKTLPGHIKEDLLQLGILRRRVNSDLGLSEFLHPNVMRLDTFHCDISSKDLLEISRCRRLRLLVMNPPRYYRFSHSTPILKQMFSNLPFLVKLHITNNDGVTDDVVSVITKTCNLVQELDLSGDYNLTDAATDSLARMCNLKAIDLSNTNIGDRGLKTLSQGPHSKMISHLRLNHCKNVSDDGIYALIQGCENLLKLIVCGWPRVSIECQLALNTFLSRQSTEKNTSM